jgi:hypothetical protein
MLQILKMLKILIGFCGKTDRNREEDYYYPHGAVCTCGSSIQVSSLRIFHIKTPIEAVKTPLSLSKGFSLEHY